MPAPSLFESILNHLKQPEYIHVLLNPLPIYGLALGALLLIVAMFLRHRKAHVVALLLIFIGAASTIPVIHYGDAGYDAIDANLGGDQAEAWLDAHGQRAMRAVPAFDALIALSLISILVPLKIPKSATILNWLTLALTIFDFGLAGWIGYAGGQAMHSEFRAGAPAETPGGYDKVR
jgi:hypothetical protein